MAGSLYLGNQKVCPVVLVGNQEPFPVRVVESKLNSSGYVDGLYRYTDLYRYYTDKPFYIDGRGIEAMEIYPGTGSISPWFVNSFRASSIKYVDFCDLSHLPTTGTISSRSTPFSYMIGETDGVHIYFRAVNSQTYFNSNIFGLLCAQATNAVVHFPSNMQSTIAGLQGYPSFGGWYTTLAFDLPATS